MRASAFTLVELMVVVTILGVLAALSMPMFASAMETARMDESVAKLRSVSLAQRMYWLEERTYANTLTDLVSSKLLDTVVDSTTKPYQFTVSASDGTTFEVEAERAESTWSGTVTIDEAGDVAGSVTSEGGRVVTPAAN